VVANGRPLADARATAEGIPLAHERYLLLRRGKKTHALLVFDDHAVEPPSS
jgi:hypothetical protein